MKKLLWFVALALLCTPALAQQDDSGFDGPPRREDRAREDRPRDEDRPRRDRRGPQNLMFEAIDVDGDSVITKQELRKAIAALQQLDADGDGNITLAEATPERRGPDRGRGGGPGGPGGDPDAFVDRFMENDANGDGKLTPDEVPERAMPMLRGGDANGDGAIDRAELAQIGENMGRRFGRGGPGERGGPGGPGGDAQGFVERLMENDRNGDGKLTPDEVPEQMGRMLRGGDVNGDGAIDARELVQVVDNFRQRARGGGRERGERGERGARGERGERPEFERPEPGR